MNNTKDAILAYMKEHKNIQMYILRNHFRSDSNYERAFSALIDENKIETKYVNGINHVRIGPAV